jgi:MoaA/NifB/PqqE/SkfB family radical SAM enzyme
VRRHGILAGLITNGFYLNPERIERLNDAGLEYLQISIDNVQPDEVSQKSLKTLDRKLEHLAAHARFHVNINSVVGAGLRNPEDALTIARRACELGFSTSIGLLHDDGGQLQPLGPRERAVYEQVSQLGHGAYTRINDFQKNLIQGRENDWSCRAGARYLYICEDGLVHYCSQQRGYPGIPLEEYNVADIEREFHTEKTCAPLCTIGCVHRASVVDRYRPQALRVLQPSEMRELGPRPEPIARLANIRSARARHIP